jgi:hypothetical protein
MKLELGSGDRPTAGYIHQEVRKIDGILKGILFIIATPLYLLQWIGFKLQPKSKNDFLDNKKND